MIILKMSAVLFSVLIALELGAYCLLALLVGKITAGAFIFEKTNVRGTVDPSFEYVLPTKANFSGKQTSDEFQVLVRTNFTGLREDHDFLLSELEVAFFGDSFTFGHGVNVEDRYTSVFAEFSDFKKVASLAYKNGFQPEHYEFFYRNSKSLRAKLVVLGLYLGNDLDADLRGTIYDYKSNSLLLPYIQILDNGQRRFRDNAYIFPINVLRDKSYFVDFAVRALSRTRFKRYLFISELGDGLESENDPELEIGTTNLKENRAVESILRFRTEAEKRGARFLVLVIPQNWHFSDQNPHIHPSLKHQVSVIRGKKNLKSEFLSLCAEVKIDCLDPTSMLSQDHYFGRDAHWNQAGHLVVGKLLAGYVRR